MAGVAAPVVAGVTGGVDGDTADGGDLPTGAGSSCLVVLQPASSASMIREWDRLLRINDMKDRTMWLLMLEGFMALMVLVFIVWWTMFSGREADPVKHDAADPHDPGAPG